MIMVKDFTDLNKHIDFNREGKKSSARKRSTKVVCCKCQKIFTLPFKPRRPEVYCDECFKKRK
jgi:CxxC-x17-CxxC domain-containing protein